MSRVITAGDMRRLEQAAVARGDTMAALMDRAGTAAANVFARRFGEVSHVLLLCGNGNNGGDGFVMASWLAEHTASSITVLMMSGEAATPLAASAFEKMDRERIRVLSLPSDASAVVGFMEAEGLSSVSHLIDAVFGIGFHGALPSSIHEAFLWLGRLSLPTLAVDIPSGMCADDGTADAAMLSPSVTVTFTAAKPCAALRSRDGLGDLEIADVGVDPLLKAAYETDVCAISQETVRERLPRRKSCSHKGTFGRLLSVCGSYGMAGASLLAGKAALRSGLGLLHVAVVREMYPIMAGQLWEAVFHPMESNEAGCFSPASLSEIKTLAGTVDAMLIGCGLGRHPDTQELLLSFLPAIKTPFVLDADGLNLLCGHILLLKASDAPRVITPHPAEAARLLETTVAEIERDRIRAAKTLAERCGAVVVLKGHRTVIASPEGVVYINETGCSGMATGGSGDVLGGMIAALLAQGLCPLSAAMCGVFLHGKAGESASARLSETAMLPSDMLEDLAHLLSQYEMRE